MKHKEKSISFKKYKNIVFISRFRIMNLLAIFYLIIGLSSCSDFVEVEAPKNLLISETVFSDPATVKSSLANIFYKIREQGMVSGREGLTTSMGIYSDELDYYGLAAPTNEIFNHNVTTSNSTLSGWWSNSYNLIYATNDIIQGVENSQNLTLEDKDYFKGQALFVRAYIHSLLSGIYGDIPYVTTTNYLENNLVSRLPVTVVYDNIISDLTNAVNLLEGTSTLEKRYYLVKMLH